MRGTGAALPALVDIHCLLYEHRQRPLATVVGIRHKLAKGQKLEKWEQQFYRENKEIVDLRPQLTKEEEAEKQRLLALLGEA